MKGVCGEKGASHVSFIIVSTSLAHGEYSVKYWLISWLVEKGERKFSNVAPARIVQISCVTDYPPAILLRLNWSEIINSTVTVKINGTFLANQRFKLQLVSTTICT